MKKYFFFLSLFILISISFNINNRKFFSFDIYADGPTFYSNINGTITAIGNTIPNSDTNGQWREVAPGVSYCIGIACVNNGGGGGGGGGGAAPLPAGTCTLSRQVCDSWTQVCGGWGACHDEPPCLATE